MVPHFPKPPVAPHVNPAFFPEGPPVSFSPNHACAYHIIIDYFSFSRRISKICKELKIIWRTSFNVNMPVITSFLKRGYCKMVLHSVLLQYECCGVVAERSYQIGEK